MKKISIRNGKIEASQIALGCMRISNLQEKNVQELIETAVAGGIDFFDHADIYGDGKSEEVFGKVLTKNARENIIIQSKCGIRKGVCYDFSKEHIIKSVEDSLKRLQIDYLDVLLLHRPDTLMVGEEVAEAFATLEEQQKVKYFGVSNQNSMQMELMKKYCGDKILINQMQLSIPHCGMIDAGLNVNTAHDLAVVRDGGILEYCRINDITIQSWSPFQSQHGVFVGNENYPELNAKMSELAKKYDVSVNAIAVAWISTHPARIQTIIGTTSCERINETCGGADVILSREEWYELYILGGKRLP